MEIAIIHDSLMEYSGTEQILKRLLKIFPQADIYTALLDLRIAKKYLSKENLEKVNVVTFNWSAIRNRIGLLQIMSPIIWKRINLEKYDLIISSSSNLLCNLINSRNKIHIRYINSLPKNLFGLAPKYKIQKILKYDKLIKYYYRQNLQKAEYILTNSKFNQKLITRLIGADSTVIYPPVQIPNKIKKNGKKSYYLIISRLDRQKNIEIAIQACNMLNQQLLIAGESYDITYKKYLKKISGPTIKFLGWQSEKDKEKLYLDAKAFIFNAINEDFGIAPVEAMAYGVPVIAYYGGGIKETVINNLTGIFYYENKCNSLVHSMLESQSKSFNPSIIHDHAKKFNENKFDAKLKRYITQILKNG